MLGRWGRARRWLPPEVRRLVDVGCAFGFGSAVLAGATMRLPNSGERDSAERGAPYVLGLEPDAGYVEQARQRYPWLPLVRADAQALPLRSGLTDAVTLLDVLEHVADVPAVIAEARRVLRPKGWVLISVPYRGPLAWLDALNIYAALRLRWSWLPPLVNSEQSAGETHRHFSCTEIQALLDEGFVIDRRARTGLGLAEALHLAVLVVCRVLLQSPGSYRVLRYIYFTAYLLEDLLPAGPAGYHLTVRAWRRPLST